MSSTASEENSQEDDEALGPDSLEDLGVKKWLQRFAFISKKHLRYDLDSNKGSFLAGLRFIIEHLQKGSSVEAITTALKNKNRNFSPVFVRDILDFISGDLKEIDNYIAGFALVLEYKLRGKSILSIRERLEDIEVIFGFFGSLFRETFIQQLILNEKQWELETLVDIHRQESLQSLR